MLQLSWMADANQEWNVIAVGGGWIECPSDHILESGSHLTLWKKCVCECV